MKLVEGVASVDDVDSFVATLTEIGDRHGVTVQAFDARYVVDRTHLERAVVLADRAFERGENVARDRGVEILLYAAGRRQISEALGMGVSTGETPVVVLVDGEDDAAGTGDDAAGTGDDAAGTGDDTAGTGDDAAGTGEAAAASDVADLLDPATTLGAVDRDRVREFFDVSGAELDAVEGDLADLVHERVALLVVEK
jgi:KEOPS complex subunit Cgi121